MNTRRGIANALFLLLFLGGIVLVASLIGSYSGPGSGNQQPPSSTSPATPGSMVPPGVALPSPTAGTQPLPPTPTPPPPQPTSPTTPQVNIPSPSTTNTNTSPAPRTTPLISPYTPTYSVDQSNDYNMVRDCMSAGITHPSCPPADIDSNGSIDSNDFAKLLFAFKYDTNNDGVVDRSTTPAPEFCFLKKSATGGVVAPPHYFDYSEFGITSPVMVFTGGVVQYPVGCATDTNGDIVLAYSALNKVRDILRRVSQNYEINLLNLYRELYNCRFGCYLSYRDFTSRAEYDAFKDILYSTLIQYDTNGDNVADMKEGGSDTLDDFNGDGVVNRLDEGFKTFVRDTILGNTGIVPINFSLNKIEATLFPFEEFNDRQVVEWCVGKEPFMGCATADVDGTCFGLLSCTVDINDLKGFDLNTEILDVNDDGKVDFSPGNSGQTDTISPTIVYLSPSNGDTVSMPFTLRVGTSEDAECRFSTISGIPYGAMTPFTSTGGTFSSQTINVPSGASYTYYVKCKDSAGNVSSEARTTFHIARAGVDTTPPKIVSSAPSGELPEYTTTATLSVTVNEDNAECRFSPNRGSSFNSMTVMNTPPGSTPAADGRVRVYDIPVSAGRSYVYYVKCRDVAGNITSNADEQEIAFNVAATGTDTTPPSILSKRPDGILPDSTTSTTLMVVTDEDAYCRFATTAKLPYASMTPFADTGGTMSKDNVRTSSGSSYVYYIKCRDLVGNVTSNNDEQSISFSVASGVPDITPPVIVDKSPTGVLSNATQYVDLQVTTDERAVCRFSTTAGQPYSAMTQFAATGNTVSTQANIPVSAGVRYTYYVRCKDVSGNISGGDTVSFSVAVEGVDVAPPAVTLSPTGTLQSGIGNVSLTAITDEPAECRFSPTAGQPYSAMTLFDTTRDTISTHDVPVTDGASYTYYVRCKDASGNISDEKTTSFSIRTSSIDTVPPTIVSVYPSDISGTERNESILPEYTTSVSLTVNTDERAVCYFATSAGQPYSAMTIFDATDSTTSSHDISVSPGSSYVYYVKCKDNAGNAMSTSDEESISFSVSPIGTDTTPPVITGAFPAGTLPNTTTSIGIVVTTDERAICRFSTSANQPYSAMTEFSSTDSITSSHSVDVDPGTSYTYYVKCADPIGNTMASDAVINFSVAN